MIMEEILDTTEYRRVKHLAELDLDYQKLHEEFEDLTQLAASISETDISLVNLLDSHMQWSVSGNVSFNPIPREESVCTYTLRESEFFEVSRLDQDSRFLDKDYVKGENGLKYYYGIPLKMETGIPVGALCVLSSKTKELNEDQIKKLHIIAREIIKRLELKLKLRRTERNADKEKQLKQRLAHDIRGPISGIVQLLNLAQEDNYTTGEMREILNLVSDSGKSVLDLTEDILQEALEAQKKDKYKFNLLTFAEKLRSLYIPQAQSKGVNFEVNFSEDISTMFPKKDLLPVSGNLISNAIKFTPPEGTVSVFLTIEENNQEKELLIMVKDTGRGMSEDKLNDLTSGEAISEQGTQGEKGFGFGLRLVMDLVEEMEGKLEASSTPGAGTKITVRLPVEFL
ncbi:GAF domain-containing sensor histidine kinase [Salegentibacter sp. JZCK2]|uniref:GAF domain-containing sensor histidine kinase n=1 Tax=Salegentibacter tibetensis TaxID=2873600 RepID=UPI001CCF8CCC|nr:GAF domain-containing sensor histidine kinase [Salegentibacter tibetensis]MBZ9729950.1 GAF domain-containing sensor histidine kinase [Salegentibacter tibetensis]